MIRAALLATAIALSSAPAWGQGNLRAKLVFVRGPGTERCPDEDVLRQQVAGELGEDPFIDASPRRVVATVARTEGSLEGFIKVLAPDGAWSEADRTKSETGDCEALVSAMALKISLILSDTSDRSAPAPLPVAKPTSTLGARLGLGVFFAPLDLTDPTAGATVSVGAREGSLSVDVEAKAHLPTSDDFDVPSPGRLSTQLAYATIAPCYHRGIVIACLLGSMGALIAGGSSASGADLGETTAPYMAVGARGGAEIPLWTGTLLRIAGDVQVPAWSPGVRASEIGQEGDSGDPVLFAARKISLGLGLVLLVEP